MDDFADIPEEHVPPVDFNQIDTIDAPKEVLSEIDNILDDSKVGGAMTSSATGDEEERLIQSVQDSLSFLWNTDMYSSMYHSTRDYLEELIGKENFEQVCYYAIPVVLLLIWTFIVLIFGYLRGRASRSSPLAGEMMKMQAKIFELEREVEKFQKNIRKAKQARSSWNTRIILLTILLEILMGVYFYFFHDSSFLPEIPSKLHYLPLFVIPVMLFIFKKVIVWYYGGVLSRSERKIKDRFEKYDYFKEKYKKLMEDNNHSQVIQSLKNIDRIKHQHMGMTPPAPTPPRTPRNEDNSPKTPSNDLIKPPTPQTPQQDNIVRNRYPAPKSTPLHKRAPPLRHTSPSIPEGKRDSPGFMGAALGIISGATNLELVQCDFCGADNGEQPKGEIKQFICRKCGKENGIKHIHSKPPPKDDDSSHSDSS